MDNTMNLEQLCRLCVQNKGYMKNIFSADVDLIEFNVKLYCCVPSIKIDEPTLPKLICHSCIKKLRYAFAFRQQCIDSTRILINKYQSIHCINISDDDVEMIEYSQPEIKQEIVENPEDSSNNVPSGTENQSNVPLNFCRINKETCRIFNDLARIGIESSKLRIESLKSKIQSMKEKESFTTPRPKIISELSITPIIEDTNSRIEETIENDSLIQDEFPITEEATANVEEESSNTAILSSNLEELPSSVEVASRRIRSPKIFDDASLMFEDESSNASKSIEGNVEESESSRIDASPVPIEDSSRIEAIPSETISIRVEEDFPMIEDESSRIDASPVPIEDSSRIEDTPSETISIRVEEDFPMIEDESSRIDASPVPIEDSSRIEDTPSETISIRVGEDFPMIEDDASPVPIEDSSRMEDIPSETISIRVEEDFPMIEDESSPIRPITEDLSTFGEESPETLIMPRLEEELQIEVQDNSQMEDESSRNSEIETITHTKCTDLEALISNAFKALHPTTGYPEQTDAVDDLINENIVDDLINENIVEDQYESEHDHTYCKHYDKQFEEEMTIKIEIADVNLEANEEMNESLHSETTNNKENMDETIMDIQNNILEPIVELSNTEEPIQTEEINKNFTMEKPEVGNFTAKKCETLKNDHELESPYICTSCDRGFNTINKLRIHLRTHITKSKELCKKCGSNITTRKAHRCCNKTEYNCSFCARTFKSAAGLFKHKYHKHIKGYVCSFCSERFTDSRTLNKHLKTHADDFNKIAVP